MENYVGLVKEASEQLMSKSNNMISVKDLTQCHRKKVFSVIDPVAMTDEELFNYISGQADHDVIQRHFMIIIIIIIIIGSRRKWMCNTSR
jgi:hypothetical protein